MYPLDSPFTDSVAQQARQVPFFVPHWAKLLQDEKDFNQALIKSILDAIGLKAIFTYLNDRTI